MSVLTLADAKLHTNISSSAGDAELQSMIDAAEGMIAKEVGPLTPTSVTDRIRCNGSALILRTTPVISLTSVTAVYVSGTVDPANLFVSPSGVVSWANTRNFFYAGWYDVTYLAGRSSVPAALLFAIKEQTAHLWQTQRGPGRSGGTPSPRTTLQVALGPEMLFPPLVREAIEPYVQDFGFA